MAYSGNNSRGLNDYYHATGGSKLQSPPVRLHWCGFVGETWAMQRAGWIFEQYRSHEHFSTVVAFHHPKSRTYGKFLVEDVWEKYGKGSIPYETSIDAKCELAGDIIIHGNFEPHKMVLLDMEPSYAPERTYISKYNLFRQAVPQETQQIIIPKELSVDEMLQSILEKQNPNQVEYFTNKVRNKERVDYNVSAQIIQLRA